MEIENKDGVNANIPEEDKTAPEIKEDDGVKPEIKPETEGVKTEEADPEATFSTEMSLEDIEKNLDAARTGVVTKKEPDKTEVKTDDKKEVVKDVVLVNEEYIKSQPEDVQEYLLSLKGKKADPDVIKIHINAQKLIAETKKQTQPTRIEQAPPTATVEALRAKIEPIKADYVKDNICTKYRIPEDIYADPESLAQWESDFNASNPRKFLEYTKDIDVLTTEANNWANAEIDKRANWQPRFTSQISNEIAKFNEALKPYDMTAKDLGIELTEEKLKDYFIIDGKANAEIVAYDGETPVLLPGKLKAALLERALPLIIKTSTERLAKPGRKIELAPSMAGSGQGEGRKLDLPKEPSVFMSLEELEKFNDNARRVAQSGG